MLQALAAKLGISGVALSGVAGVVAILINFILSKFKIKEKFEGWNDNLENKYKGWLAKFLKGSGTFFYNIGVWLTGFATTHKLLGVIYQKAIEPLLIIVLETLKNILVFTVDFVVGIIETGVDKLIKGLRSDNKDKK